MGRPRKRQFIERPAVDANAPASLPVDREMMSGLDDDFLMDPILEDAITPYALQTEHTPIITETVTFAASQQASTYEDGRRVWHFAQDFAPPIDFGTDVPTPVLDPPSQGISPASSDAISSEHQHDIQPVKCSCLASIYLALASLQQFPSEISTALAVVRSAGHTAQNVLRCQACGCAPLAEVRPPIEAFQNTMLLGTIIPTITDGYQKMLTMIDCETNVAKAAGSKKVFRLKDYGGVYGMNGLCCPTMTNFENVEMDPYEWRTTVRALLRTDIYGHEDMSTGIKGILDEMEQRAKLRHDKLDAMFVAGLLSKSDGRLCVGEKDRGCKRIMDTARMALDDLVIA